MTRFARAHGSKSSNERMPEAATPWSIMRTQLQQSQDQDKNAAERAKVAVFDLINHFIYNFVNFYLSILFACLV